MAYKPYKPRKEKDIYARYDGKNTKANNYDNGSVKLFGFRSTNFFYCRVIIRVHSLYKGGYNNLNETASESKN